MISQNCYKHYQEGKAKRKPRTPVITMTKFNTLFFFVALFERTKGNQNFENLTDTCVATETLTAMECNCDDLASSSGFDCQYNNDTDTEQVVSECGDDWMPIQIPCATSLSMANMFVDEESFTLEFCAEYNRASWKGEELCISATFVVSEVPSYCNATVNGETCTTCSVCEGANGIELDCSNLLPAMISTCPTPAATAESRKSTLFESNENNAQLRGATTGRSFDLFNPDYHVQIDMYAILFGGVLEVKFYADPGHEKYLAKFQSFFYGVGVGTFSANGGAWFDYNVVWLREQGWKATFCLSAAAVGIQGVAVGGSSIPMWGLAGEEIGGVMAWASNAVFAAAMCGQGSFVY
jgi:hypothetical protein